MSMELLRLGLQFFAGETKEEKDEVIIPGEEGVTGAIGVTESTLPAYTMPQNTVAAPKAQDFDTWYKANGGMDEAGYYAKYDLDPERDYQNTVNTLNYEYQTSMANYGENAEKMYHMGLQNSGVSDIFQANAFSAYLGNMNQAAADRITARKRNKAAFNDYVAGKKTEYGQYESGIKSEYDTKLNSALTYALSKYNGYNLNQILSELGVSGYYTEIVQDVANRLSGMDSTTLKAETEGALAQSIINSISGFTGSDADKAAAKSMFGGMFPNNVIEAAFGRAQAIYNNSPEAADATVQSWVDTLYGSFTGNEVDFNDWDNYQLADVPENLRVKIKEAIRQQFDSRVNTIYDAVVAEYSPDQKEGIRSYYTQKGYSKYEIDAAISAAEDFYNKNPNTQAEIVKGFIDQYYGNYDGTNIDSIDLDGIKDADMQTKVKEGIQQRFKDNVAEIYTMIREKYTPENANAMKLDLQNSYPDKYTQYEIDAAFNQASAVYQNSSMGQAATTEENVNAIISSFGENGANFDPSNYGNNKQTFINEMIKDGTYNKEEAGQAWEQMNSAYLKRRDDLDAWVSENFWDESGNNTWDGSELSKATLKEMLGTTVTEKEYKYIVDKLNTRMENLIEGAKKTARENAENEIKTVKDNLTTIGNDRGYLTIEDYFDAYDQYGAIGENYGNEFSQPDMDEINNIVNGIIRDALSGTTSDFASIDTANTLEGIISKDDIANWKTMSNDQRRRVVLNGAISSGRFTASERSAMVATYIAERVQEIVDTDNSSAKASGLADAGELVNYINSLGLNKQERQKAMESIRRGMSFRIEGDQINWYGSVKGAEATFRGAREKGNKVTDSNILSMLGDVSGSNIKTYKAINGVLYELVPATDYTNAYWVEMKPDNIEIVGDGHTNTAEQRKGIYDLLVYMLELENKLATDAGYIEGELPTSTTVTVGGDSTSKGFKTGSGPSGGGHSKDFATQNK